MPERESASPQHDPDARLGDLFENLPDPSQQIPTVDNTPPVPGSRRAAREAAAVQPPAVPAVPSPDTSTGEDLTTQAMPAAAAGDSIDPRSAAPTPSADAVTSAERASVAPSDAPTGDEAPTRAGDGSVAGGRLEDLFDGHPEDHTGNRPPAKKKRRAGCLVAFIIVLAVIGGIVGAGVWAWNAYGDKISDALGWGDPKDWEPGMATGEVLVTIHEGDTGAPVSTALYEAGVTRSEDVFYDYLVTENIAITFYPGIYSLKEKMTAEAALQALQNPDNKRENSASVGEGATIESSLPDMAESLGMPIEELQAAVDADPATYGVTAQSLEGWLFPAVYTFDPEVTATQVIQRMVDRTKEALTEAGVPAEDAQRVLTIASIIQREGLTGDFPKVSRVIENRLDIDMKLQMDSTAQYGYGSLHEGVVSSSAEALEDDNLWNTYVHTGLPVTPIASPSYAAIDAAMHPADGPWLYFVTTNLATGETQFSVTYEEHLQGVEKWEQWCQENPDGGCSAG
ncbi:endolytic transglycosylase MltG [Microbacterium sp. WCS2018Hpa-9]|uniref:endolytic transglycosylase MltG n=1 Tax=Microbacterium sp. WCS2018Hpa-9 TaxID=3073635 RepID=UPI00288B523D|nr:endolytic transglycosylase MltG [Microbacterium sp. WCS2018Hpa-9]